LDNILIYSKTETEYIEYVRQVLAKLVIVLLLLELEKYKFYKEEVIFLGFIVGRNKIYIDLIKVNTVLT
jgi:hypothetical protein